MFTKFRTIGTLSILFSQLFAVAPAFAQQMYYDDRGNTYFDFICHAHNARGECTNYSYITPSSRFRGYNNQYSSYTNGRSTSDRYRRLTNTTRYNSVYDNSIYDYNYNTRSNTSYPYDYYTSPYDDTRYYRGSNYTSDPYYRGGQYYDEDYYRDWYRRRYGNDDNCRSCDCDDDDDCDD